MPPSGELTCLRSVLINTLMYTISFDPEAFSGAGLQTTGQLLPIGFLFLTLVIVQYCDY